MVRGGDVTFCDQLLGLGVVDLEEEGVQSAAVEQDAEGLDDWVFFHYYIFVC